MTTQGEVTAAQASREPEPTADAVAPRWRFWPLLALAGTAAILLVIYWFSQVRSPIGFGYFSHPPIYGVWAPVLSSQAIAVIPAGVLLAAAGWWFTAHRRAPAWLGLGVLVVCGVATAAAVGLVRGDWHDLVRGISTAETSPYYTSDLHFVYEYGVRGFAERHPDLTPAFHSYSSKTHPPGVLILLYGLFRLIGESHTLRIATVIAGIAMCAAVAAWLIGRTLGGERSGRIAAALFVAAPGPLMLAYTNLDTVFATFMAGGAALMVLAIYRRSVAAAAAAGAVLGLGTIMTYATVFITLAATIAAVIQLSKRDALRLLGAAAIGGVVVLALARLLIGFDVLASYHSSPQAGRPYDAYWIIASPAAWAIVAGLPIAALGVAGLVRKVPGAHRPVLPIVLVIIMVVWAALPPDVTKLRPGEVERTWAFLYPILAGVAGPVVDRWIRPLGRWAGAVVAGLVVLSVGQAVLLQSLWDNMY